jgi:hypothetical protein
MFIRTREVFRLDYVIGSLCLQLWLFTPVLVASIHWYNNHRVVALIREMKKNMSSPSTRRRRFAWKMLALQIVITAAQFSIMFHHLAVLKYEWSFAYVSCIIGCNWFSHVPLVQLFVWMSSLGFMYSEAMSSALEGITRPNSSRSEETSLRQLKTVCLKSY